MDEILLQDPELAQAIILESQRQVTKLELIASENFVSPAVREAQGSVMTHKYAEGYPSFPSRMFPRRLPPFLQ